VDKILAIITCTDRCGYALFVSLLLPCQELDPFFPGRLILFFKFVAGFPQRKERKGKERKGKGERIASLILGSGGGDEVS